MLIGASKSQPEPVLRAALDAGLRHFGENKVQEAQRKWPSLRAEYSDLALHLIGPLQSNKAADAVALFDVVQTLDRPKIIDAMANEVARGTWRAAGKDAPPAFLIQVNTGEESQKSGVAPGGLAALVNQAREARLDLRGLMCVPPAGANPAPHFALLAKLAAEHGLSWLSMGMSGDFEAAIRLGATHVRVGTALFGKRI